MEWISRYISDFGGDPSSVTLFGESTGGADVLCHLLSTTNQTRPLFHRAIVQSAIIDYNMPDVHGAGLYFSRVKSTLHVSTLDQLRAVDADKLVDIGCPLRAIDDGVFFRPGWREAIMPKEVARRQHLAESHLNTPHAYPHLSQDVAQVLRLTLAIIVRAAAILAFVHAAAHHRRLRERVHHLVRPCISLDDERRHPPP
jgi:hypothetical protein